MAYRKGCKIISYTPGFIPFGVVYHVTLALVRIVGWAVFGVRILGRGNLVGVRNAVLVSNHTLLFDPGFIAHAIRPRRTYFTMLEETALIPYLGTFVRLLGGVPIPESAGTLRVLDGAARTALRTLGLIHFFPEGECYVRNQELQPFHPGVFLLACRLRLPVVPISTVLHERTGIAGLLRFPPQVTMVIGAPIQPPSSSGSSLGSASRAMGSLVRERMQAVIDSHAGSKNIYKGKMPRLVRHSDEDAEAGQRRPAETHAAPVA